MKGVVLAGGLGTRLDPLTRVTNKHLLPVYRRPLIYYPLLTLAGAGIREALVVTGGNSAGDFLRLLGNGQEFGFASLNYAYQQGAGGIAEALGLAEGFAAGGPVMVILGDNVFERSLAGAAERYRRQGGGARILLKEVMHPERFGVAEMDGDRVVKITEKPKKPASRLAVIGAYFFDGQVYEIIRGLERSARGELEITDVNNAYLARGQLHGEVLDGWWIDAGSSFDSLLRATQLVAEKEEKEEKDKR